MMKAYRSIVVIILVLMLALPATAAGAASASISLTSPTPNPAMIGSEIAFDLAVSVDGFQTGVSGIDLYLNYDPAVVTPPTTPGASAAEVLPDFFGVSNFSINEVLPAAQCPGATKPCIHLVLAGPPQTSQIGIAARFHFRVTAVGSGSACFSIVQATMVDANGFNVPYVKSPGDLCQTIQNRATTGTVLRQGVPANPNPGGGTLACSSVTATGTWVYGPVVTNTDGNFSFTNLPAGTYTFRATYPGYLTSQKTGVAIPDNSITGNVGSTTLRGGDVNGDNAINILDIGAVISKFGKTGVAVRSAGGNCTTDEPADINDDGTVNISDLAITAGNWGTMGPTTWQP